MFHLTTRVVFLALLFATGSPVRGAEGDETKALVGRWKVVEMQARGRSISGASWQGMRYEFKKDSYKMWAGRTTPAGRAGKPPLHGPYSVDNKKVPRHFNFTMVAGESRHDVQAIYKIVDKKLFLCLSATGRPESFDTADSKSLCYVLERQAPAAEGSEVAEESPDEE